MTQLGLAAAAVCLALGGAALRLASQLPAWDMAFTSNRDGDSDIYLFDIQHNFLFNLTNHPARDEYPTWSPDGNQIAFVSNRDGISAIYVMDMNGERIHPIYHSRFPLRRLAWSPDGRQIAFDSQLDGDDEIYLIDLDTYNVSQLTENDALDRSPAWTPDGDRIAFSSNRTGVFDVYLMNADGSEGCALFDQSDDASLFASLSPSWSPDGRHLLLTRSSQGASAIFVASLTVAACQVEGEPFWLADLDGIKRYENPSWSSDGSPIAFVSKDDGSLTWDIWIVRTDGAGVQRVTDNIADDVSPAWRP